FSVCEHFTGTGLMPLLDAWSPDAVVLDNVMEGATGLELLSSIRRRHPATPVVLVTAFGGSDTASEALRLGATYYMDKPVRVARLLDVLRAALAPTGGGTSAGAAPGGAIGLPGARGDVTRPEPPGAPLDDPRALAREIVNAARSSGGLLLFARFEGTL